jgi:Holliday junction resolvasome RuvABC endonuclease subunit
MKLKTIAGIDYSLTSPAVCIYIEEVDGGYFDFDRCMLYYLFNNKRQQQLSTGCGIGNIFAHPYPEWSTEEERHEKLSAWTMTLIQGCDEVHIEGYAFATSAQAGVRSIAENTGLLKNKMWLGRIPFKNYPPTVIKKFATGKGNANKELMYEAFISELLTPNDLKERLTPKATKITNPVSDIVDAYFIAKAGAEGLLWHR